MTETDTEADGSSAKELIESIKRTFSGVDRPVTANEFARLYGVIAAQHEANMAVYLLAMQANPKLIFSDASQNAQSAMKATVSELTDALKDLARASMSDEDKARVEAEDEQP